MSNSIKYQKLLKKFNNNFSDTDPRIPEVMHQLTIAVKYYADKKSLKFEQDIMNYLFNELIYIKNPYKKF